MHLGVHRCAVAHIAQGDNSVFAKLCRGVDERVDYIVFAVAVTVTRRALVSKIQQISEHRALTQYHDTRGHVVGWLAVSDDDKCREASCNETGHLPDCGSTRSPADLTQSAHRRPSTSAGALVLDDRRSCHCRFPCTRYRMAWRISRVKLTYLRWIQSGMRIEWKCAAPLLTALLDFIFGPVVPLPNWKWRTKVEITSLECRKWRTEAKITSLVKRKWRTEVKITSLEGESSKRGSRHFLIYPPESMSPLYTTSPSSPVRS